MKKQAGFGIQAMLVMGAVMAAMCVGGWFYYKDTQATIAELVGKNVALNIQVEEDKLIIEQAQNDAKQQGIINGVINKKFADTRKQVTELEGKLKKKNLITGKERDIGKLAIWKPPVLEKVFTNGTKEALRCVELASGAEHTVEELTAERKSQINDLCTELANPNYLPH